MQVQPSQGDPTVARLQLDVDTPGDGSAEPRRDVFVGGEPRGDTRGEDIAVVAGIMLPLRY